MNSELALAGVALMLAAQPARGQCSHQEIPSPGGGFDDSFGESVAIDDDTLLVGDYRSGGRGAAFVHEWDGATWVEVARLRPDHPQLDGRFGFRVALDAGVAAVSAPGTDDAVYVFEQRGSDWPLVARLEPSHCAPSLFGVSLALKRSVLVVGDSQCVTVFGRTGAAWRETAHFASTHSNFGQAVATDGDTILVGTDVPYPRVATFERRGLDWVEGPPIVPSDWLRFGSSVAVDGEVALIGDPGYADIDGQAQVFRKNGSRWVHEQVLRVTGSPTGDWLGWNVALEGDRAVVTSDCFLMFRGRAHVFERIGGRWIEVAVVADFFCAPPRSVDLSRGRIVMGLGGQRVHVFGGLDCGSTAPFCEPSLPPGDDFAARISTTGSLHTSDETFVLTAHDCPPGATGMFFYAATPTKVPFESGYLCVGPSNIFRLPPFVVSAWGIARHHVSFSRPPAGSGPGQIVPGSTWYFQFAFHDAGTLALTEGMRVTFCP